MCWRGGEDDGVVSGLGYTAEQCQRGEQCQCVDFHNYPPSGFPYHGGFIIFTLKIAHFVATRQVVEEYYHVLIILHICVGRGQRDQVDCDDTINGVVMRQRLFFLVLALALTACGEHAGGEGRRGADKALPVEVVVVKRQPVKSSLVLSGTLRAQRVARLAVQQEGRVERLLLREGDTVEADAPLLVLDDALLQAQLRKSRAQRRQAEQNVKRLRRLKSGSAVAEDELARATTALDVARAEEDELGLLLAQTTIRAPFSGVLTERLVEEGDTLSRFTHVLTVVDNQQLYSRLTISELLLPGLAEGDEVGVQVDALNGMKLRGKIRRIYPTIDPQNQQGSIEVALLDMPPGVRPGQLVRVDLQLNRPEQVQIPYTALRRDNLGEFVYVVQNERVQRRDVRSGRYLDASVEILQGLEEGERIVSQGFLGLSEGASVAPKSQKETMQ